MHDSAQKMWHFLLVCSSVQASFFAMKMAASTRGWTDRATSALLEALNSRESLWNTKCESDRNRNTKKKHYDEIVIILKEDCAHGRTHHLLLRFLRGENVDIL